MTLDVRSEDELHVLLLNYVRSTEVGQVYAKGVVEVVDFIMSEIPNGIEAHWVRERFGERFSATAGMFERISRSRGKANTYPTLVRLVGRVLDEVNSDFITLEFSNRLFIQALDIGHYFEQTRRADVIWLVEGAALRCLGCRVELKQEFNYQAFGFHAPLDEDVLELL